MAQSGNSDAKKRLSIVKEELELFKSLMKGHEKLFWAIGKL